MNPAQVRSEDPLAARLAGELRVLSGKLKRRLREQNQVGEGGLTWSHVAVLGRLEREGPATVTALARALVMRPQSMGALVAALETAGLVRRTPDPGDGRQTLLAITEACRERVAAWRAAREDWLCRAIQAQLSAAEQRQLAGALALIKRIVES
jgi:DNA-binding MarR family transcriptional regulator